jgi:hypothetical protein
MIEALLQAERLLIHGMVDQAERIYAGAFEQDPLNAIAVVGLARVALERGDDQTAYARARQALDIDPQNAAAIRLEARLAEVFAARAEAQAEAQAAPPGSPQLPQEPATAPAREVRPSEQSILARNPSMAEHQRMEDASRFPPAPDAPDEPIDRRPGLLRRLFGA